MNILRYKRMVLELSQEDLALKSGLKQCQISQFETGRLQPYPPQAERLAVVLGIDADDLQKEIS